MCDTSLKTYLLANARNIFNQEVRVTFYNNDLMIPIFCDVNNN